MSYVESNLIPGEKVRYKTGLHWIVLFWPAVLCLVFGVTGLVLLVGVVGPKGGSSKAMAIVGLLCLVVGGLIALMGHFVRAATEIAVTNKRVIVKTGLLARKTVELLLSKVESIGVDESVWGRMLGYGSVVVRGTGGTPEPFHRVGHPLEFRRQVQEQIEALRQLGSSGV